MQIATNGAYNRSPFTDGLLLPFGTNPNNFQGSHSAPYENGNWFDNLRLSARMFNEISGRGYNREETAGIYRAGSKSGPGYRARVNEFRKLSPGYDSYFNCLRRQGTLP